MGHIAHNTHLVENRQAGATCCKHHASLPGVQAVATGFAAVWDVGAEMLHVWAAGCGSGVMVG